MLMEFNLKSRKIFMSAVGVTCFNIILYRLSYSSFVPFGVSKYSWIKWLTGSFKNGEEKQKQKQQNHHFPFPDVWYILMRRNSLWYRILTLPAERMKHTWISQVVGVSSQIITIIHFFIIHFYFLLFFHKLHHLKENHTNKQSCILVTYFTILLFKYQKISRMW